MDIIRDLGALRSAVAALRASQPVALVPTMGALHAGHIALVDAARQSGAAVVASIFVNPLQFGAGEDLARYPRREATDARMLSEAGCALLWVPDAATMYPDGFVTSIAVGGVGEVIEGAARPGHFAGVATVVAKLLNQVAPDRAYFGEKDYQQLLVIRRLVRDLDLPVEIIGVPIQRDDDGLALSSRNIYLTAEEREKAVALPRALGEAARAIGRGDTAGTALAAAEAALASAGFQLDYLALVDAETLAQAPPTRRRRLLAAARLGTTRLVDNLAIDSSEVSTSSLSR